MKSIRHVLLECKGRMQAIDIAMHKSASTKP